MEKKLGRYLNDVAPRAGAWIETGTTTRKCTSSRVAPRAGAWIETTLCWARDG